MKKFECGLLYLVMWLKIKYLLENQKNGPKLGTQMVPENGTIFGFRGPDFAAHPARIPRPGALALAIHCGAVFLSIAKHLLCRFHNISIILLFLRVRIFEIYFVSIENLHGSIVGNRSHDGRGVGVVSIRIILFHR